MTKDPYEYPKIRRSAEVRIERANNEPVIILICSLGVVANPLALVAATAPILARFDGLHSVDTIVSELAHYGVNEQLVKELIMLLDRELFLETSRFYRAQQRVRDDFLANPVRPASITGDGFGSTAKSIQTEIEKYFQAESIQTDQSKTSSIVGLVSPHIDYQRGASCYAITYNELRNRQPHDLYLLLGTSHQYSAHLFHLTRKDFAQPSGVVTCDRTFVNQLAIQYGEQRSFADELLHKKEHSIELQLPFLQHVLNEPRIVPILIGSFHELLREDRLPQSYEPYEAFLEALAEVVRGRQAQGQRICVIGAVDMSHIGTNFGGSQSLSEGWLAEIRLSDQSYIEAVCTRDKAALLEQIATTADATNICGYSTLYTMLDLFDRLGVDCEGKLLDYQQATDWTNDCCVTFAGISFRKTTTE